MRPETTPGPGRFQFPGVTVLPPSRGRAEGRRWRQLKAQIIRRDHGTCHICGGPGADSADHLVPEAHGGPRWDPANLAAVHHNAGPKCNRIRGARSVQQARADIARLTTTTGLDW